MFEAARIHFLGSRLSPLPIVQRALTIFIGIPSDSLCRERIFKIILLHSLISFYKRNVKECELAMNNTSLLACFLVDVYGQVEVIAYF